MKRLFLLYILSVGANVSLKAQHELNLYFMDTVYQSNFTNPAFSADKGRTTISMPSFYTNISSPYSASQLTVAKDGKNVITLESLFKAATPVSHIFNNFELQTTGIALGFNRLNISFYHKFKGETHLNFAKDLIGGLAYGNGAYLGKTLELGSGLTGQLYSEMSLGAAYKVNDNLSVGLRIKRLAGFAGIQTQKQKLNLTTDSSNYKLTINTDFDIRTYDFKRLEDMSNGNYSFAELFSSDNNGFSFDLGGTYKIGKWRFDASIIDLGGAIKWKNGAKTYSSAGTYEYSGEKSDKFLSFDQMKSDGMQDTIKKVLNLQEGTSGESTIKIPMKTYLGAQYALSEKIRLGGLLYFETWDGISKLDIMVNSTFRLGKAMHVGINYSARNGTYDNLGGNIVFNLGPLQIYALSDNLMAFMNKAKAKSTNVRFGTNFVF